MADEDADEDDAEADEVEGFAAVVATMDDADGDVVITFDVDEVVCTLFPLSMLVDNWCCDFELSKFNKLALVVDVRALPVDDELASLGVVVCCCCCN